MTPRRRWAACSSRLGRSVDEPFEVAGEMISLTMSAGLACSPRDGNEMRNPAAWRRRRPLRGQSASRGRTQGWWELAGTRRTPTRLRLPASADGRANTCRGGERLPDGRTLPMFVASYREQLFAGGLEMFMQPGRGPSTPATSTSSSPWPGCGCGRRQPCTAGSVPPSTSARPRRTGCSGRDSTRCWPASRPGTGWGCPPRSPSTLRRPACWTRTACVSLKRPSAGTRSRRRGWSWNYSKPRPRTGTCSGGPWTAWSSWASDSPWMISARATAA